MKRPRGLRIAALAAAVVLSVALAGNLARADEESWFWKKVKKVFVDWDDNAEPGDPKTEVAGVRGVDVEDKMGDKGYDWEAVSYMEDFQLSMEAHKRFLKDAGLGPYQGK
ncbi:MAG: hypothetical protein R6V10_02840 [bacterium]